MNDHGKSDKSVVAKKSANKGSGAPESAESAEPRDLAKGNAEGETRSRTQIREILKQDLDRIRKAAQKDSGTQFTALWHHVYNIDRLREAYFSLKRQAAAGVDRVTWQAFGEDLEENLQDLSARLKRGAYRAKPVRRVTIPKATGGERNLGVPTLEDKIVQRATTEVMGAIYEIDFLGFSYGFRSGRSQHDALDALAVGIETRKVNWVLDADIRGFFDAIDHEWMMKFVEHRITDKRVQRHIQKWLNAGVVEDGELHRAERGTPQGGSISPLLANIYLHYVFDLWAHQWRGRHARGDVIIVRYADDIIVGFQHEADATRFKQDLEERLARFKLELHPDKTRLLEFGRFATEQRANRGLGKPETFDFLGFTHICAKTRGGRQQFVVRRKTSRKRMGRKLKEIKAALRDRMHDDPDVVGAWLRSVLQGHYNYFGVPLNSKALGQMRHAVRRLWHRVLRRRSQKGDLTWEDASRRYLERWLPYPKIQHPWPNQRLRVRTRGRSPVR